MSKPFPKPTDQQILAALKRAGPATPSYVVRNWLQDHEFGRFTNLETSHVLYRLKKLERFGRVRRSKHQHFSNMICWEIAEPN